MKHFYISIAIFAGIILSGITSNLMVNRFSNNMSEFFDDYIRIESITNDEVKNIESIKNEFFRQKNMLQLFINKEHIQDIELDILLIEDAIKNNDADLCRENSIEVTSKLAFLKESIFAVD